MKTSSLIGLKPLSGSGLKITKRPKTRYRKKAMDQIQKLWVGIRKNAQKLTWTKGSLCPIHLSTPYTSLSSCLQVKTKQSKWCSNYWICKRCIIKNKTLNLRNLIHLWLYWPFFVSLLAKTQHILRFSRTIIAKMRKWDANISFPFYVHISVDQVIYNFLKALTDQLVGGGGQRRLIRSVLGNLRVGWFFLSHFKGPSSHDQLKTLRLVKVTLCWFV